MKQFILSAEPDKDGLVRLSGGDYRYLVRVRRLSPGEYFPALLPNGDKIIVHVVSVDNQTLVGEISPDNLSSPSVLPQAPDHQSSIPNSSAAQDRFSKMLHHRAYAMSHHSKDALNVSHADSGVLTPHSHIVLFQALPKGEKMDLIVRQAAEGAIAEIVPFSSEFSLKKVSVTKFTRWERIIKEARQQSGSTVATKIRQPLSIDGLFAYWEQLQANAQAPDPQSSLLGLLFHHLPIEKISLHRYLNSKPEIVILTIGPEGGFSSTEVQRFLTAGFKPFTIEGPVLRAETAALYAHAAVRILLLEKDSWEMK